VSGKAQIRLISCRQQELAPRSEEGPELSMESVKKSIATSAEAWQLYRSQPVFPAAVALAMLYLTVMNFVSQLSLCHAVDPPN